ncbi:MAG: hypothetical protein PF440_04130 [Thiomicrorhabdus sp.]|jgi:hypothetical protein|nr:hypothetical protein [Thiomicrorhabdus sp.]
MANVIFQKKLYTIDKTDDMYISLEADDTSPLIQVTPVSLVISEAFSFATPVITATFIDGLGIYFNLDKMNTDDVYWLNIGKDLKNSQRFPMKISKVSLKNTVGGTNSQLAFKVSFVHYGWSELLNKRHNRAWTNLRYSDVMQVIADECKYNKVTIEPSSKNKETLIQPYWSNLTMMKWIQERANPLNFNEHMEYWCTYKGEFIFKSISGIIAENRNDIVNKVIPVIRLEGQYSKEFEREEITDNNGKIPNYFSNFQASEYYLDSVISGAGGATSMYYDFSTGKYTNNNVKISDTYATQLSDWNSIKTSHEVTGMRMFGGRDTSNTDNAFAKLSSISLSTNQFEVTLENSFNLHVGDVIEVIIPTDKEVNKIPVNVFYSGIYIVASVTHLIPIGDSIAITTANLARHGFDGKDMTGYTKTKTGKFIGK